MLARIGVKKALHRHEMRQFNLDRKDIHWDIGRRNKDSALPVITGVDAMTRHAKLGLRR
jgi:hypothetical protein